MEKINIDIEQFENEGFCIIKNIIPESTLATLDQSCDACIKKTHQEMDQANTNILGLSHRGSRYFISNQHKKLKLKKLEDFLFSELMASITHKLVGETVYLFNEQFVVKSPDRGMKFSWHQDSGYIGHDHQPYLTCWIPMVDMNEKNGTVYVLPTSDSKIKKVIQHSKDKKSNDLVGYTGNKKGIPAIVNRGDIVCFSSLTFHRSSENNSNQMRPAYIAQYSPEIIMQKNGQKPWAFADPLILNGKIISH
jgi:ectoine hydroxylase-related dioxygenase (phytanoyl-CoA dioxygenase family)